MWQIFRQIFKENITCWMEERPDRKWLQPDAPTLEYWLKVVWKIYKMKRITLSVKMHRNLRDWGQNGPGLLTLGDQFWFKCLTNLPFTLKFWGGCAVSRILRINEWVWHLLFKVIRVIGGGKLSRVMTWCTCQRNVGVALCIFICYLLHMWLVPLNLGLHLTSVIKI